MKSYTLQNNRSICRISRTKQMRKFWQKKGAIIKDTIDPVITKKMKIGREFGRVAAVIIQAFQRPYFFSYSGWYIICCCNAGTVS